MKKWIFLTAALLVAAPAAFSADRGWTPFKAPRPSWYPQAGAIGKTEKATPPAFTLSQEAAERARKYSEWTPFRAPRPSWYPQAGAISKKEKARPPAFTLSQETAERAGKDSPWTPFRAPRPSWYPQAGAISGGEKAAVATSF
jgi:hypothetical protein